MPYFGHVGKEPNDSTDEGDRAEDQLDPDCCEYTSVIDGRQCIRLPEHDGGHRFTEPDGNDVDYRFQGRPWFEPSVRTRSIDYNRGVIERKSEPLALPSPQPYRYSKWTPKRYRFQETIDLDEFHRLIPMAHRCDPDNLDDLTTLGFFYEHEDEDGEKCGGFIRICQDPQHSGEGSLWTVDREKPLKLTPSVVCRSCGDHGWVEGGLWRETLTSTSLNGTFLEAIDYGPVTVVFFMNDMGRLFTMGAESKQFWKRANELDLKPDTKVRIGRSGLGGLTELDLPGYSDYNTGGWSWSGWGSDFFGTSKKEKKKQKRERKRKLKNEPLASNKQGRKRTPL